MAVVASQIEDSAALLRHARHKLISGIVKHFKRESLRKIIEEVQRLGGKAALNSPWSKSAGDACDEARSPMVLAAINHNLDAMQLLLNTGLIDLNAENTKGIPLLISVCRTGNEEAVAMLLRRKGVSIDIESAVDKQPLHEAFFSSLKFDYSVVFHSDWGSPDLKRSLIDWWKGSEFTPSKPLKVKARWPGAIPLVALLLEKGADPTVKVSYCGISPLTAVQNPSCLLKSAESLALAHLPGTVDFHSSRKSDPSKEANDILTFRVVLRDRSTKRKLEVMVDVDYNMELPKDVDAGISSEIREILASKKTRTMRGLIEAYAPKHKEREVADAKLEREVAALKQQAKHDQHAIEYAREQKARADRLTAMREHKNPSVRKFFDTFSKLLDQLLFQCKLHLHNLDPTKGKKFDKAGLAVKITGLAINVFAPPPFNVIGTVVDALGQKVVNREKFKARTRVVDLVERDHGKMCDTLACELSTHFEQQLTIMDPSQADELAKYGVGAILALMCANGSKEDEIVLDRDESSLEKIQKRILDAIVSPTTASKRFHETLGKYLLSPPAAEESSQIAEGSQQQPKGLFARLWRKPAGPKFTITPPSSKLILPAGDMQSTSSPGAFLPSYDAQARSKSPSPASSSGSSTPEKEQHQRRTPSPMPGRRPVTDPIIVVS